MRAYLTVVCAGLLLAGSRTCFGSKSWLEFRDSRHLVATDAGVSTGRSVLSRLRQIDDAFGVNSAVPADPAGPIRVFVFDSEQELAEFRTHGWQSGLTLTRGRQAPVILVYSSPRLDYLLGHEYAHAVIDGWHWTLPEWFEEGLAELMASAEIGTNSVRLGKAIASHLEILNRQGIDREVFSPRPPSDPNPALFYATSWALVHMLHFDPRYRDKLPSLLDQLQEKSPRFGSFEKTYGKSTKQVLEDLSAYSRNLSWPGTKYDSLPQSADSAVAPAVPISGSDAQFLLSDLALDLGRTAAALRRFAQIAKEHKDDSLGDEALGLAELAKGNPAGAIPHLRAAANRGSRNARVWSELATLQREAGASWLDIKPDLIQAATLDPTDFQANFLLGVRASDDGELLAAATFLAAAAQAAPGRADVWHAFALALLRAGRTAEAQRAIQHGLKAASSLEQEEMLTQLSATVKSPKALPSQQKAPVTVSPAWTKLKPDAFVEGRLVELTCAGERTELKIDVSGKLFILKIVNPQDVELLGAGSSAPSAEFRCGKQSGQIVRAGYLRNSNTVLSLEFLQVHGIAQF